MSAVGLLFQNCHKEQTTESFYTKRIFGQEFGQNKIILLLHLFIAHIRKGLHAGLGFLRIFLHKSKKKYDDSFPEAQGILGIRVYQYSCIEQLYQRLGSTACFPCKNRTK